MAVLGPDGAGKSAVIAQLRCDERFSGKLRIHFRPRFGRGTHDGPEVTTPHAKPPRSRLTTLLKLIVWVIDYWYGYLAMIAPAVRSGRLVAFDRFYDDVLVDPRRYRVQGSSLSLARWCSRLMPQPHLFVVLDVPAAILQQRKHEVSREEAERQCIAYRQFAAASPNRVLVTADRPLDKVVQEVSSILLNVEENHASDSSKSSLPSSR